MHECDTLTQYTKEIFPGSALPNNAMTEQQKFSFSSLFERLDGLMLRDRSRLPVACTA
jgi:ATP-dependent helicase HrpA